MKKIANVKNEFGTTVGYIFIENGNYIFSRRGCIPSVFSNELDVIENEIKNDDFLRSFGCHPVYLKSFLKTKQK